MTSIRNNLRDNSVAEEGYLDAARACILDVGVRRTTISDIARRAGVARMTIYRSWPDVTALLGDLLVREWLEEVALDDRVHAAEGGESGFDLDAFAAAMADLVGSLRANALFRKIVDVDPEFLLPYVVQRRGRLQDHLLDLLAAAVAAGQDAGRVRDGEPGVLARALLLAALGSVLSQQTVADDPATPAALDAELRSMIARYLAP